MSTAVFCQGASVLEGVHTAAEGSQKLSTCITTAAEHAALNAGEETFPGIVQAWLVRNAVRLQKEALLFTDERSKLEGELLNGIDVVKCNSWEVMVTPSCTRVLRTYSVSC